MKTQLQLESEAALERMKRALEGKPPLAREDEVVEFLRRTFGMDEKERK